MLIEVKSGETNPTKSLIRFSQILQTTLNFQLVRKANVRKQFPDSKIEILSVERFLAGLV
ncbi:MAG: hypothetical protein HS115_00830 [Spirochaetales bacterium]|nr:hypothetical protein [Spirochaetales bacterium]